jgi:alpha-ketoglutarate-dependent taurine dioxygenase
LHRQGQHYITVAHAAVMEHHPIDEQLVFGEVITGVDLAAPLEPATWRAIEDSLHAHGVLVFKHQGHLTVEQQHAFASRWGHIQDHGAIPIMSITNVSSRGETLRPATTGFYNLQGNEGWHIDNTYQPRSAKAGILRAETVPSGGTMTAFCDGWAAYDALDDATRERIHGLAAFHSGLYSQAKLGQDPTGATPEAPVTGGLYVARAYLRPLVKTHPVSGRNALQIGRHAFGIPGLSDEESDELLEHLLRFAADDPTRTYYHQWEVGDLLIWDSALLCSVLGFVRPLSPAAALTLS